MNIWTDVIVTYKPTTINAKINVTFKTLNDWTLHSAFSIPKLHNDISFFQSFQLLLIAFAFQHHRWYWSPYTFPFIYAWKQYNIYIYIAVNSSRSIGLKTLPDSYINSIDHLKRKIWTLNTKTTIWLQDIKLTKSRAQSVNIWQKLVGV